MRQGGKTILVLALLAVSAGANFPVAAYLQNRWKDPEVRRTASYLNAPPATRWPEPAPPQWPPPDINLRVATLGSTMRQWATVIVVQEERFVPGAQLQGKPDAERFDRYVESGFPFRALRMIILGERWNVTPPVGYTPRPVMMGRQWPVHPIVLGFIGNTLVYAAVLWCVGYGVPTGVPRLLNLTRRRRACKCRCGYDRHGLPAGAPCPECGSAVPTRCTACGYDRRGLPQDSPCPECGGTP
jgi:hypothetical protein